MTDIKHNALLFSEAVFDKRMIAEASDLGIKPADMWAYVRDPSSCSTISIESPTGRPTEWAWCSNITTDDDLVAVVFKPTPATLSLAPHLLGWTVHILND